MHGWLTMDIFMNSGLLADFGSLAQLVAVWNGIWPYLVMILGFSVIIFVHELGHFLLAKWADVRVERFAVGFGRELIGFTRGETRYSLNVLPFGGYVKMLGQEDFDDKSDELLFKNDPRSFIAKPIGPRMAIVSAGVIANILLACFLFMIVFMIGMERIGPSIGTVEPDSPADKAGLLPGDKMLTVNGESILEFTDLRMAVILASRHEPLVFVVERNGERIGPIYVEPDYRRPESTRDVRRQTIGVMPGVTRKIIWTGPTIDNSKPESPHVGDILVEADGVAITKENATAMHSTLVYAKEIYVERADPKNPDAPPQRVRVEIPPRLEIYPSDSSDRRTVSVLGLTPLVRFGSFDSDGRGALAGLEIGDTVLEWDDIPFPNREDVRQAVHQNSENDIHFKVRRVGGRIVEGFVRPKRNRHGAGTIQALCEDIPDADAAEEGVRARFQRVRPYGIAAEASVESGDGVVAVNDIQHPTAAQVRKLIRGASGKLVSLTLQKASGATVQTAVRPQRSGSIDAGFSLVADDWLQVGQIVPAIAGKPSPAAEAGIPSGVRILKVNEQAVSTWRDLIRRFREYAGGPVDLTYLDLDGGTHVVPFHVPHSLRTLLGIGPEARIVSVDGTTSVEIETGRGMETVHVAYHEGLRSLLSDLVGKKHVAVGLRPTVLSPIETRYIDVTEDMVDPWVGRIAFRPNIDVAREMRILKGKNVLDAVRIGIHKTYYFILQVYTTIERMVVSRTVGVENLSGPLGIVSIGGQIARAGFVEFLFFMAIISANLAVINFLPLPIVDGGLMVFLIIEKIKGSPVSLRVQVATQMIGLFLIIGAFIFVTYNDALRMWG